MRVSFHRRRHMSLPPQRRRSPRVIVVVIALTTATMAFAASHIGRSRELPAAMLIESQRADQATRDVVDQRLQARLKKQLKQQEE